MSKYNRDRLLKFSDSTWIENASFLLLKPRTTKLNKPFIHHALTWCAVFSGGNMKDPLLHQAFPKLALCSSYFFQNYSMLRYQYQPLLNLFFSFGTAKKQILKLSDENQVEKTHNTLYSKEKLWTSTVSLHDLKISQSF